MSVVIPTTCRLGRVAEAGELVPCHKHGPSFWCYVQQDGSHLDLEACQCLSYPSHACPVDAHRARARAAAHHTFTARESHSHLG
ncbi:MAG TPA: hypothetical protein VFI42_00515 [Thermomicrobiaceae bacterium]|nr:hypothetical protein [Thermomicrobiaceae bacterium]